MAGRSLLICLSHSIRRTQHTTPWLSYQSPFQSLLSQFGGCSGSFTHFRHLGSSCREELLNRPAASFRASSPRSNLFSVSTPLSEVGCRALLPLDGRGVGLPVITSCQALSFASSALEIEEDETVRLAAEIGYEVLGQYVPEGPRIEPQAAFAVIQVGSHQFKVTPGDMVYTEKLKYADINDKVYLLKVLEEWVENFHVKGNRASPQPSGERPNLAVHHKEKKAICPGQLLLNKVLLMGSLEQTIIGRPTIPEAGVLAAVEEIALDAKVIVFKKKRRKNYRRTNGHRQELTRLRILRIEGIEAPASASDDKVLLKENPV